MASLRKNPVVYEINTWPWLSSLSQEYGRHMTLADVPLEAWDAIAAWKLDAVWLMGIWERSPAGLQITMQDKGLMAAFRRILPDFKSEDVNGSAYCIRQYEVDTHFGSRQGLAMARRALAERGIALYLDFVPNHVALDHPWVKQHPEYFILGSAADLESAPQEFRRVGDTIIARGRDPYFPPWHDVLQLNAFNGGMRKSTVAVLKDIASQCDGVRCDMAMLLLTDVFSQTWGKRAGDCPQAEFWAEVINAVKAEYPDFVFIAEAYWDKERELQQLGFDYCYDKRLYDRLVTKSVDAVRSSLQAEPEYQGRLVRFIENHDEPRAAATFSETEERAAAVTFATQMGMRLFHEGQFEGRKVKLPVFLSRRPEEPLDMDVQGFYRRLLAALHSEVFHDGEWRSCSCSGWSDNSSYRNLLAWSWYTPAELALVVVNLSGGPAAGRVQVPWQALSGRSWKLTDLLSNEIYVRAGDEMGDPGLFVDLVPWGIHFLHSDGREL